MHFSKKDLFTVPNIMSYFRILLTPVFCVVYLCNPNIYGRIWSVVIILISAATDIADGFVARKTGQVTDLGKIMDPVADKAMQAAMLFCVIVQYPWVALLIVIFGIKELVSLALTSYLLAHNKNIDGAMWCGKLCTVVLYIVLVSFIALPPLPDPVVFILIGFSAAFMLLAFVVYMKAYILLLLELKREQKSAKRAAAERR